MAAVRETQSSVERRGTGTATQVNTFKLLDADGSGELDFVEFCATFYLYCTFTWAGLVKYAFDITDVDRSGFLDMNEVESVSVHESNVAAHLLPPPNHDLHAIDATPARRCGGVDSSQLDGASTAASSPRNDLVKNYRVHPTHWLISTQVVMSVGLRLHGQKER